MTGKRVFRMAPLQHHFELSGWAETTIVVRFWLIAALCVAAGLGLFYVEWMPDSDRSHGTACSRACARRSASPAGPVGRGCWPRGARASSSWSAPGDDERAAAAELAGLGVEVRFGDRGAARRAPTWSSPRRLARRTTRCSPPPRAAGIEVIGEVELAWRLRPARRGAVAGDDRHQRQDHRRAHAHRHAAGRRAQGASPSATSACPSSRPSREPLRRAGRGAVELPAALVQPAAPRTPRPCSTSRPTTSTGTARWRSTPRAKGQHLRRRAGTVVHNADDEWSARLAERADPRAVGLHARRRPAPGSSAWWRTCWSTGPSWPTPRETAEELAALADVRPFAPHNVANALAAAALARALRRAAPRPYARACGTSCPTRTGSRTSDRVGEVDYVDDSKATNPHAAAASLAAYRVDRVDRRRAAQGRRRGRARTAGRAAGCAARCCWASIAAGSPRLWRDTRRMSRWWTSPGKTLGSMDRVVTEAARLATPGDTVLLAPAGASLDMFANYPARGEAFAACRPAALPGGDVSATTEEPRRAARARPTRRRAGPASGSPRCKELLDRPLTSYYLILGCSALLLALGLMMVLSASSIEALQETGNPFYWFVKQSLSVGDRPAADVGLRAAAAQVLPLRRLPADGAVDHRRWSWCCSSASAGAAARSAGSTSAPFQLQPSEPAKLGPGPVGRRPAGPQGRAPAGSSGGSCSSR